ncbi:hypothetical protein L1987_31454 [Smallanthus sonchifolius]|uniref:Uncharacterized protein n=1 Tax=Smallanthus sonchifolius TaxID=185202 RepID=A0ACB9I504_9ASTR|nr:hypothetical protein L1987_31454 [Smallanthus sonchifolius]
MDAGCNCFEIDHFICQGTIQSRNYHFTWMIKNGWYKLPLCVFSLHQLTDLYLSCIDLDHQPVFSGFGSLRSLCLNHVKISTKALLHLLSNCPSLKSFNLARAPTPIGDKDCTVTELFGCLPMIDNLTTWESVVNPTQFRKNFQHH